jgi:hypothetical protein
LLVVVDGTGQAQKNASGPALFIFFLEIFTTTTTTTFSLFIEMMNEPASST